MRVEKFLHWEEFPEKVNSKMSFGGASNNSQIDRKLQEELIAEDQKQRFQSQIHAFTDMCWEKCVDKPGSKLDGKTETCLVNCVERFLDTNIFIAKRFAEKFKGWASRIFKCSSIVTRSAKSRTIKVSQERNTLYIIICVWFELKDIFDLPVQWANTVSWDRLRLRPFFVQHWRFGVTLASGVVGVRGLR